MIKDSLFSFIFENEIVTFKSYVSKFKSKHSQEFDLKAEKLGLKSKILDLFIGKKVNATEGLAAWHPKYRFQYNPLGQDTPSNKKQESELIKLHSLLKEAKNIIMIGIGGSFEGPKMLLENIGNDYDNVNFVFITGSDPNEFFVKTKKLNRNDTFFIISSKSFSTQETILTLKDAISWSGDTDKFVAITTHKNKVEKYNIKNIIEFDEEIGGRYSIWSEISLVINLLSKTDFDLFMAGGKQADIDLDNDDSYFKFVKNLAYSDIWFNNFMNKFSRVVLSYIWKWRSFPDYVQQLEMESLGKRPNKNYEYKKTGQIVFGGYGPIAQHSYFQLLHQGTQDLCADIIVSNHDKKSLAYAQAITQSKLLSQGCEELGGVESINGNIPTNLFLINNPGIYELGYLTATWEHRVYITSIMLGINPFDQFGVNAGKFYTNKYLVDKD